MAKSLFASLPHRAKKAVIIEPENDDFLAEESNNFYKPGNNQGLFHDTNKAFTSQNKYKFNIGLHLFYIGRQSIEIKSPLILSI